MRDGFHSFNTPENIKSMNEWNKIFGRDSAKREEMYPSPLPKHYQEVKVKKA